MSLTVVVPVHNGITTLPRCVAALEASTLPEGRWDLVIVDDGSTDDSAAWAREHGLEVRQVADGPLGPAAARNLGARGSTRDVVVFVDADVCVSPQTLERFASLFEERPELGAAFGAYDDQPEHTGFVSQYRNLYHRYVHLHGAGPAETFWAGCGAVRRSAFEASGGFDEIRFPRPQIEDIELGYRLRASGWPIELDPELECRHLKAWTLGGVVTTDFRDRGVPWMALLLGGNHPPSLNIDRAERIKTVAVGATLLALPWAAWIRSALPLLVGLLVLLAVTASNAGLYRWFARRRGSGFALGVVPLNTLYYATSFMAAVFGTVVYVGGRLSGRRPRP
ncbi:MAG: glycosyltransferase [Gemmatimonadota bacterium]